MKISAIIPVYNGISHTKKMIQSLELNWPANIDFDVYIVDNASTDGTTDYLKELNKNKYHIINNKINLGYAIANNQAARATNSDIIILLNNDVILNENWLKPMIYGIKEENTVIVGNIHFDINNININHTGIALDNCGWPYHLKYDISNQKTEYINATATSGACMCINRNWFIDVGGFDIKYLNGYEDLDLCMTANLFNKKILISTKSTIRHYGSATEGRFDYEDLNALRFKYKWNKYIN
jgi:GT2 family glycosyltransferase